MKEINVPHAEDDPASRACCGRLWAYVATRRNNTWCSRSFWPTLLMKDYTILRYDDDRSEMTMRDFARCMRRIRQIRCMVGQGWLGRTMDAASCRADAVMGAYADKRVISSASSLTRYLDDHVRWIDTLGAWWGKIDGLKKTLIFNDRRSAIWRCATGRREPRSVRLGVREHPAAAARPGRILSYVINERATSAEIAVLGNRPAATCVDSALKSKARVAGPVVAIRSATSSQSHGLHYRCTYAQSTRSSACSAHPCAFWMRVEGQLPHSRVGELS